MRSSPSGSLASLFIVHDDASSESPEKCCFSSSSRTVFAASIETTLGATIRGDETRVGGSAGLSFEIYNLQRLW